MSRDSASIAAIAASDTGGPCTPCRLVTVTLACSAGWSVMPSSPVPSACTHLRLTASFRSSFRFFIICPKVSSASACRIAVSGFRRLVHHVDLKLGKGARKAQPVLLGDIGRQRQKDQQSGHGSIRSSSAVERV